MTSTQRLPLLAGVAAPVLYVASDVLVGAVSPTYSSAHQVVSEISALGAPTRPVWIAVAVAFNLLLAAFAWGVWHGAGARRGLRAAAIVLAVLALMGVPWVVLAPMHQRGEPTSLTDTLHIAFAGAQVLLSLAALALAAASLPGRFRLASLVLAAAMVGAGGLTGLDSGGLASGAPTPWLGLIERISVYAYLAWLGILATTLLRESAPDETRLSYDAPPGPARPRSAGRSW